MKFGTFNDKHDDKVDNSSPNCLTIWTGPDTITPSDSLDKVANSLVRFPNHWLAEICPIEIISIRISNLEISDFIDLGPA